MELLNIEEIKKANTKILGKTIEYYEQISSTHTYAKTIANQIKNNGKIILAEEQTQAIGTKGRSWYTGKRKNIAMTIIFHPNCEVKQLEGFTLKIAECMKQTIKQLYQIDLTIKPPNDLFINGKKVCGILTEINSIGENVNYGLISLGMNVKEQQFSEETKSIATSLIKQVQKELRREEIINSFIEKMEKEIEW